MRVRVTNESAHAGRLLVDHGDRDDDDQPPRLKEVPAGASLELAITQRGMLEVLDFKAKVVPVPKHAKPEKPSKTKARRAK
jgi:hypothetical protein